MKGGFSTYDQYISDHRPIGMSIAVAGIGTNARQPVENMGSLKLNHTAEWLNLQHEALPERAIFQIYGMDGKIYSSEVLHSGRSHISINTSHLTMGIYVVRLSTQSATIAIEKWILSR